MTTITVVDLTGKSKQRVRDVGECKAVVFTDDYRRCANLAVWLRGGMLLCVPHARLDEVEVQA